MANNRAPRWGRQHAEYLRDLFSNGGADPNGVQGTAHINAVHQAHPQMWGNMTARNFQANFRRSAAEFLANQEVEGRRREQHQGVAEGKLLLFRNIERTTISTNTL